MHPYGGMARTIKVFNDRVSMTLCTVSAKNERTIGKAASESDWCNHGVAVTQAQV